MFSGIRSCRSFPRVVPFAWHNNLYMQFGDVDGHGLFGVLDETAEGLLCHDCGWGGQHLGLHVYRAHGLTASGHRLAHGLRRTRGLVRAATRAVIIQSATLRYTKPWCRFSPGS
jgi:hypothetical protein